MHQKMVNLNSVKQYSLLIAVITCITACEPFKEAPKKGPLVGKWYAASRNYKATIDKQIVTDTTETYIGGTFYKEFTETIAYSVSIVNFKTVRDTSHYIYKDTHQLIVYKPNNLANRDTIDAIVSGLDLQITRSSSAVLKDPKTGKDELYEEIETIFFNKVN